MLKNRKERQDFLIELKSKPCLDCGTLFPWFVMDFDHVPERGEKLFKLGTNQMMTNTEEDFTNEISKCDLVCAVCHRKRTQSRLPEGRLNQHMVSRYEWLIEVKTSPCTDCGNLFPWYCMDFDHVPERGEKSFAVGMTQVKKKPMAKLLEEIEKCDLVCAVCHRIRTHERGYPGTGSTNFKDKCDRGHDLADPSNHILFQGKRKGCLQCSRITAREYYWKIQNKDIGSERERFENERKKR